MGAVEGWARFDGIPGFAAALGDRYEPHVYEGAPHAFFYDERPSYRVDAARLAWARTLASLAA